MPITVSNAPYLFIPGGFLESERKSQNFKKNILSVVPINKTAYYLFSCIQQTIGYNRVTFIDEQRSDYSVFPLDILDFINDGVVAANMPDEYFDYLFDQEYIFLLPEILKKNFRFKIPNTLEIICPVELNVDFLSIQETSAIFDYIKCSYRLSIIFKIHNTLTSQEIEFLNLFNLSQSFYSISYLIVENLFMEYSKLLPNSSRFIKNESSNCSFRIDYINYYQTINNNNFSYRKVFYDSERKTFKDSYGSILFEFNADYNIDNLYSYFESAVYTVFKNGLDVCKDCEFRNICVDIRVPYKRVENEWYHKSECNYNPYISKWKGEKDYLPIALCGVISNENGFTIDHKLIANINKQFSEGE